MKFCALLIALAAMCTGTARAQDVSESAMQIAKLILDKKWFVARLTLPNLFDHLQVQAERQLISRSSAIAFRDEMMKAATEDLFVRSYATTVDDNFTFEERQQLLSFLDTTAGAKFQRFKLADEFAPFLRAFTRQGCDGVLARTSGADQQELKTICETLRSQ